MTTAVGLLLGVGLLLVPFQRLVHFLHEGMEMHTPFAPVGYRLVEGIHEEALAAPDTAPEIHTARRRRTRQQLLQPIVA